MHSAVLFYKLKISNSCFTLGLVIQSATFDASNGRAFSSKVLTASLRYNATRRVKLHISLLASFIF